MGSEKDLIEKIQTVPLVLKQSDIDALTEMHRLKPRKFIGMVKSVLVQCEKKGDYSAFLELTRYLTRTITDISPFLSQAVNRMFLSWYKKKDLVSIAEWSFLLEECGNEACMLMLDEIVKNPNVGKFVKSQDQYKFKKALYVLKQKLEGRDVTIKVDMDIKDPDLEWRDNV